MADNLSVISTVLFIVAGVCLAVAIVLFFSLNIPSVIGDLSGRTARRSIKNMRASNEKSGAKGYKTDKINAERGKLTATMKQERVLENTAAKKDKKAVSAAQNKNDGTARAEFKQSVPENNSKSSNVPETGLLYNPNVTSFSEPTELLAASPLDAEEYPQESSRVPESRKKQLVLIENIMMIHTDEVI